MCDAWHHREIVAPALPSRRRPVRNHFTSLHISAGAASAAPVSKQHERLRQRPAKFYISSSTTTRRRSQSHLLQSSLRQGGTFHVFNSSNFVCQLLALLPLQRRQALLGECAQRFPVLAQIDLCAYQDYGRVRTVVLDLRKPLGRDILEGGRAGHAKAYEEDVGLGIGEGSQPVVVFLAGRVPQPAGHLYAVHDHGGRVIIEAARRGDEIKRAAW